MLSAGGGNVNRVIDGFCRALEILIAALLAVMVVMVFGNVVLRYGFNSGIIVSEEVSRWLFLWLTFLGAILALKEHGHLGTDALISRLPVLGKKICLVLGHLLMLYATWLVFSGALTQVRINLNVEAPVTGVSMAFVYGTGVVFAVFAAPLLLRDLWRILTGALSEADLVMVKGTEEKGEVDALQSTPAGGTTAGPIPASKGIRQ
jgi:TRAP-type C4-dicarboxylate transport system permease small subunit